MAKKMIINSDICDARKVTEKALEAYESIVINSDILLVNDRSKELLDQYPVVFNVDRTLELEGDVKISTVNGSARIAAADTVPEEKQYLIVNGSVTIDPGTEKVLENYLGMTVNGSVTYPESLSGYMSMATVNGASVCYPDNAIILKKNAVIDRLFALRAKPSLYWSSKRMIMVDPQMDPAALYAKGAKFQAKQVILADSKVEGVIDLIDEQADIVIVPDGTSVICDDVELESGVIKRWGDKLYILGELKVTGDSRETLEQIAYLNVRGDVQVEESLRDLLLEKAQEIAGEVRVPRGREISGQVAAKISRWLLEQEMRGITVSNCALVKLDKDIPNELILERLQISDCASVSCTEEQAAAVSAVSESVTMIGEGGIGDLVKKVVGENGVAGAGDLLKTKVVNSDYYVM